MRILITGVGSEGAYGVIKSLRSYYGKNISIIGLDTEPFIANQKFLDKFIISIKRDSEMYYEYILDVIKNNNIDVFWPIPTAELDFFSCKRDEIEELTNAKVIISDRKSINIANNKSNLFNFFKSKKGKIIPKYKVYNTYNEVEKAVLEFGYPKEKVCLKTVKGSGSRGFRILNSQYNELNGLFNEYPNNVCCKWEKIKDILKSAKTLPSIMIMEYLPGKEYDVDVLCYEGKSYYVIPRINKKMYYGMSLVTKTCIYKEIEKLSRYIVKELNLSYIISLTFKLDEQDNPKLLEINPRVPGTIIATLRSGVNYSKLALDLALDKYKDENINLNLNKTIVRYWEDIVMEDQNEQE